MSASEARARFRRRDLSPIELVEAVIKRAEEVNPRVCAFVSTSFDRALDSARAAERRYSRSHTAPRELEGIPIAIKDAHPIRGEKTTYGSRVFLGERDCV